MIEAGSITIEPGGHVVYYDDDLLLRPGAQRHFQSRPPRITGSAETNAALTELSRESLASEVHQASGMVAAQLGVTPADALDRLRSWSSDHERTLEEAAEEVLGRELRLS